MKNKLFEQYFMKYRNLVMRLVMYKTRNYQAAQEICQQVFVALYTNMDKVSPELVKAWLIKTTKNAIIDYIRRAKVREELYIDISVVDRGGLLAEKVLEHHEQRLDNLALAGKILRTVRAANEQWYDILVMYCVDGLTYAEIAEELKISVPVVRARMYRARMFVREKFGKEYHEN